MQTIDLTKPMRKLFKDISEDTRKQVFEMYMNSGNNSYAAIGEKVGLNYSMVAKIVEIEMGEYRKNKSK